ncbi:14118_t:CDS:2, partial [Racocetra fulgida]
CPGEGQCINGHCILSNTTGTPSPALKSGIAYLFNQRSGADGLGHVAWGYLRDATEYTYGSLDGPESSMTSSSNGFWVHSGTFEEMITTFQSQEYDSYIHGVVDKPNVQNAIQMEEYLVNIPYDLIVNDCCDREIRTGKTQDLNKHMNLNGNLRKGQCQPALLIMQNVGNITLEQNTPQTENVTPEQNPPSTPEGDLISFDENLPTLQPREASAPAVDPEIGSSIKQNKTILIYKNIPNGIEFYDGKGKWYGVKEDFRTLSNKYYFIKTDLKETTIEAYKRINEESEAIAEKTNEQKENAWLNLATTGTLVFAEKYEGEAIQYDVNSMYTYEMLKKEASWPIAPGKFHTINSSFTEKWSKFPYGIYKATIEGNPSKNIRITGKDMFGKWGIILYNIKKEGGIAGKVSKALLVSLWGVL